MAFSFVWHDKISVRIIKGTDRSHLYWYRVVVGQSNFPYDQTKNAQIIAMSVRIHTMQPNSDANLKLFEQELQIFKCFSMCPSYLQDITVQPQIFEGLMIRKKYSSIKIYNACDVPENDWLGWIGTSSYWWTNNTYRKRKHTYTFNDLEKETEVVFSGVQFRRTFN